MILPRMTYGKRNNNFMRILEFRSFSDLILFFHERPKFLEHLSSYESFLEPTPPTRYKLKGYFWLYISNNDFQRFETSLGITSNDVGIKKKVKNILSGNVGTIYATDDLSNNPQHIKVRTDKGYATWLLKNVEAVK